MSQPPFPSQPGPQAPYQQSPYQSGPGQMPYPPQQPAPAKKKWFKRPLVWIIAVIVVIAIAVNGGGNGDGEGTAAAPTTSTAPSELAADSASAADASQGETPDQASAPEPAEQRTPMSVTASTMIDDLESNALKAENTYKGQYLEVTGYVSNIDAQGKYFSVDGGPDTFTFTNVQAFITPEQQTQVADFDKGEQVTFIGEVTDVGEIMGYSIDVESIQ